MLEKTVSDVNLSYKIETLPEPLHVHVDIQ